MQGTSKEALDRLRSLSLVYAAALQAIRDHLRRLGLTEVDVPILVGITGACENVSTLFRLAHGPRIHLTQTGQLALEHSLQVSHGVFCITRSFRTDQIDHRHLNEFTLVEEEVSCVHPSIGVGCEDYRPDAMLGSLLEHVSWAVKAGLGEILEAADGIRVDGDAIRAAIELDFPCIRYDEGLALLNEAGGGERLSWGGDLTREQEVRLVSIVARDLRIPEVPVFVTHYPKEIKFFNMAESRRDDRVVLSADLLLPRVGEAVGSAVREHEASRLEKRLVTSIMYRHIIEQGLGTLDDFEPYLEIIREGRTAPHAGYGIGLERVLQFALAEPDIRRASTPFALSQLMGFDRVIELAQTGSESPGF